MVKAAVIEPLDYIDQVFGPGGLLASSELNATVRPGQIVMAQHVDAALRTGTHLMCEAGTGTGKSYAYLIPIIQRELTAIIVTRNNLLSDQLFRKDLPFLQTVLPWSFTFAQLKGKNRYLCTRKFPRSDAPPVSREEDVRADATVTAWSRQTATGDFSELPFEVPDRLMRRYTVHQDECERRKCKDFNRCFYYLAKSKAARANIVITNYHVFFSHLRYGRILPDFDATVWDESHQAPSIAREFFGFRLTEGTIKRIADRVGKLSGGKGDAADDVRKRLREQGARLFFDLYAYQQSHSFDVRLKTPLKIFISDITGSLRSAASIFKHHAAQFPDLRDPGAQESLRLARRSSEIADQIVRVFQLAEPGRYIYRVVEEDKRAVLICMAIDPSEFLGPHLRGVPVEPEDAGDREEDDGIVGQKPRKSAASYILTSATITTPEVGGRPSFEFLRKNLGVEKASTCIAESPFQFGKQALLIIPWNAPSPPEGRLSPGERAKRTEAWRVAIADMVVKIVELARGRTLALFTSNKSLATTHDVLLRRQLSYRVLRQGGGIPNARLVEEFRRDVGSVLLGVDSFWQGIDVPGESLSCVVIDKIPYTFGALDPVLDALEERDGKQVAFRQYNLPRAVLQFRQAFGRLIRTETDKGVVVMLDPRVRREPQFLAGLPPGVRVSGDLDDIPVLLDGAAPVVLQMPPPPVVL